MKAPTHSQENLHDDLIAAVRARGNDATTLRDAAHEAHHALSAEVKGPWTRTNIDRHVQRKRRGWAVGDEALARAVEQIVCADLGVDCGSVEKWAMNSCMESIKIDRIDIPYELLLSAIQSAMKDGRGRAAADRVLALVKTVKTTQKEEEAMS